jgi:replicative DNA helicase
MGKSALALQMAIDLALQNKRILFLSLEMTVESMVERLFCNQYDVDNFDVLQGKLKINKDIASKWISFKDRIKDIPLILTCGIGMNFQEVTDVIEHLEEKPDVIFVDYVQAIRINRSEREVLNEYIRHFRGLCVFNKIAGVLCSQSNRQTFDDDNKRPTLANLKGTGFLEEHADCVILLHWPHFYDNSKNQNEYIVDIAKQRNGRTGECVLHYKPEYYKFYDVDLKTDETESPTP